MTAKRFALITVIALLLISGTAYAIYKNQQPEVVFRAPTQTESSTSSVVRSSALSTLSRSSSSEQVSVASSAPIIEAPSSVQIDVPFASQAPLGNWDMPYQEACEEASLILVNAYLNQSGMTPNTMDQEILSIVAHEENVLSMPPDIGMEDLGRVAESHFGLSARATSDVTIDSIIAELAQGNPVIVPLAGRDLGNPYYSGEGPWYHVLVITGYDGKNFITNDVGTKRGEGYKYPYNTLYSAIHDWTGIKEEIRSGPKMMLVVTK